MDRIEKLLDSVLKMDFIEESFSDIALQRPEIEENKIKDFQSKIESFFAQQSIECKEAALGLYISRCSEANYHQLTILFQSLDLLVKDNILGSRIVCEQILSSEKLDNKNELFFVECFKVIKRLIGGVDYKGVREIMKLCREKVNSFPQSFPTSLNPQITSVCDVLKYIFDRNACLLPAYFIITELQKQENVDVHWKISTLTANFIEEFVNLAQMLSIIGHSSMYPILEPASASGYGDNTNPWRLDMNLKFTTLKGNLPYDSELTQPQVGLLRYVLQQLYSKEMVCSMLNLQKQRSAVLEEQLVWLVINAMEKSEQEVTMETKNDPYDSTPTHKEWFWLHLSSQLIYFVLFQCATFPNIVNELHEKLTLMNLRKGRDDLMWALLQYISGSIQRNALSNFLPVLKLYDILYTEKEPLPVPDVKFPSSTKKIAATCIYIHLLKKAQLENVVIRPIPTALRKHYEFLQQLSTAQSLAIGDDYIVTLLCNAYSTNQEYFSRPMSALIDTILTNNKPQTQAAQQALTTVPLSMVILDSLTVHSKMSIIHCVVNNLMKQAETKGTMPSMLPHISPALVETYSRLLVYTEIESLGIKGFLSRLLPTVCKSNAWTILYTLLEMFSYRLFHIQAHYRAQLLLQLHNLTQNSHINQAQLHLCFESTALRLLTGLGSFEFQFQLSRFLTEPKNMAFVSNDNEELNRVLILTMARSIHITSTGDLRIPGNSSEGGNNVYLMDLLNVVMKNTPHNWANHTRACFPKALQDFYANHTHPAEDKQILKKNIEEEYRNFLSMPNDNDTINYFSQRPSFLCLLFKMISDTGEVSQLAYKVLERIGARLFSAQLRTLCDFLLYEVTLFSSSRQQIPKLVDCINDMIWKWNIVTIDRLVLCLALRTQESNQIDMPTAQVFVIQLLLIKSSHFRDRVIKFVENNSPEYWKQSNWHEKQSAFQNEFPEKFAPSDEHSQPLPVYFGNVCLRFLPVLDLVIHRYLEMSVETIAAPLESILKTLGMLYKFHDRPITYLYNTLFYYELKLRDRPLLKRMLIGTIIQSMSSVREKNWALTEQYQMYVKNQIPEESPSSNMAANIVKWKPDLSYYMSLVKRLIESKF
jgi:mediator of RNA polymerase II transcription subunit 23